MRAEARRDVLAGFVAAGASLLAAGSAKAVSGVDLFDDRTARDRGFDLIYEARDLDLPQNQRDGLTQARSNLDLTKKRVKESEARIDNDLLPSIQKAYWCDPKAAGVERSKFTDGNARHKRPMDFHEQIGKGWLRSGPAVQKEDKETLCTP